MTEEHISELRALCAEYERNKSIDEALGHGDQAADIAADGVGRKALEALPELLDELEYKNRSLKLSKYWHSKAEINVKSARDELVDCCESLFDLVDCLSTWLANAYIDPCLLPDVGRNDIEPPQPEDVIAYAKECIRDRP